MTPWDEVEKRANELLAKFTAPADKGRIHWMEANVYGQSDIRGHGADVIRHAKEALKYERDPVQRGWLYMYLGDAAGLDWKSKDEATRWYLKGGNLNCWRSSCHRKLPNFRRSASSGGW